MTDAPTTMPVDVEGLAERLEAADIRTTASLSTSDFRPSRAHLESLRNLIRQAATVLRDLCDERDAALAVAILPLEADEIEGLMKHWPRVVSTMLTAERDAENSQADNTRLREELSLARSLIVNAYPDPGDGSFDEVSLADLVRMVVGERDEALSAEGRDYVLIERLAFEASQWAKDPRHNIGADQPSLVFARRFAFLLANKIKEKRV